MTAKRIEQLRRIESAAIATCAAHLQLMECIEHPKDWQCFDARVRALQARLGEQLEAVGGPLEVDAPTPLSTNRDARQLTIDGAEE